MTLGLNSELCDVLTCLILTPHSQLCRSLENQQDGAESVELFQIPILRGLPLSDLIIKGNCLRFQLR